MITLCNIERASSVRRLRRPRMTPQLCHCRPASQIVFSSAGPCASSSAWTAAPASARTVAPAFARLTNAQLPCEPPRGRCWLPSQRNSSCWERASIVMFSSPIPSGVLSALPPLLRAWLACCSHCSAPPLGGRSTHVLLPAAFQPGISQSSDFSPDERKALRGKVL